MDKETFFGLTRLLKKSMAVITASVGALLAGHASAQSTNDGTDPSDTGSEHNKTRALKPQLILKPNPNNSNVLLAMHTSHSSHSSHSSHYSGSTSGHVSHSSHSSHYSSSPSYTPQNSYPYTVPSTPIERPKRATQGRLISPSNTTTNDTTSFSTSEPPTTLKRVLRKGCSGKDVEALQALLNTDGYDTMITGYFGDNTEASVEAFQRANNLTPDGVVGHKTYRLLQNK